MRAILPLCIVWFSPKQKRARKPSRCSVCFVKRDDSLLRCLLVQTKRHFIMYILGHHCAFRLFIDRRRKTAEIVIASQTLHRIYTHASTCIQCASLIYYIDRMLNLTRVFFQVPTLVGGNFTFTLLVQDDSSTILVITFGNIQHQIRASRTTDVAFTIDFPLLISGLFRHLLSILNDGRFGLHFTTTDVEHLGRVGIDEIAIFITPQLVQAVFALLRVDNDRSLILVVIDVGIHKHRVNLQAQNTSYLSRAFAHVKDTAVHLAFDEIHGTSHFERKFR